MATVRNDKDYPVDLSSGRTLNPWRSGGGTAEVDPAAPHEAALINAGVLYVTDSESSPPLPDSKTLNVRGEVDYDYAGPNPVELDFTGGGWDETEDGRFHPTVVDVAALASDSELAAAILAIGGRFRGAYAGATAYKAKDLVTNADALYSRNSDGTPAGAFNAGEWTQVTAETSGLPDHLADTVDAHNASAISFVPAGTLSSTDVQAALEELDDDIQGIDTGGGSGAAASAVEGYTVKVPCATNLIHAGQSGGAGSTAVTGANAASTSVTTKTPHVITHDTVGNFRLRYANADWTDGSPGAITSLSAAVITADGTIWAVTFSGGASTALAIGASVESDAVPGLAPKRGDRVIVITLVTAAVAGAWAGTFHWSGIDQTAKIANQTIGVQSGNHLDNSGTFSVPASTYGFGPVGIVADTAEPVRAVAVVGDSIVASPGFNATGGFVRDPLDAAGVPMIMTAVAGSTWPAGHNAHLAAFAGCSDAIVEHGTNYAGFGYDLKDVALGIANDLALADILRVYQTTLTPRASGFRVEVGAFNDWVRAGLPVDPNTLDAVAVGTPSALLAGEAGHPHAGWLEVGGLVEKPFTSETWNPTYDNGDAVHPNAAGRAVMKQAVQASQYGGYKAGSIDAAAKAVGAPFALQSGGIYLPRHTARVDSALQFGTSTSYGYSIPLRVEAPCVISGLTAWIRTAGGSGETMRLSLHADNGNIPGARLADGGTFDATVTGVVTKTIAVNIDTPRRVWVILWRIAGGATVPVMASFTDTGDYNGGGYDSSSALIYNGRLCTDNAAAGAPATPTVANQLNKAPLLGYVVA